MVPGVLIVGAEATVRDYFRCADQSNSLYLQIAPRLAAAGRYTELGPGHDVDIEYSGRTMMLISSIRVES